MELNEIKILIDKYFEGETTLAEERALASYLATAESLPEEHHAVKAMFEAMGLLREITAPESRPQKRGYSLRHIGGVAAAVACLLIGIVVATRTLNSAPVYAEPEFICYVNGSAVDDPKLAEEEARRILGNMNQNINLAIARIDKVNLLKTK